MQLLKSLYRIFFKYGKDYGHVQHNSKLGGYIETIFIFVLLIPATIGYSIFLIWVVKEGYAILFSNALVIPSIVLTFAGLTAVWLYIIRGLLQKKPILEWFDDEQGDDNVSNE